MTDLNQCTFTGRIGADPEIRRTQDWGPIANLRLAVGQQWRDRNTGERKEKTEWVSVVVFNEGLCKVIEQYVHKGSRILVQGQWQTRKWQDKDGNDRYSTECVIQGFGGQFIMLDGKKDDSSSDERQQDQGVSYSSNDLDDEIPF